MKKNFIYHEIFGRSYNAAVQRSQTYKKNAPEKDSDYFKVPTVLKK